MMLPRSKTPLSFESTGNYDKKAWAEIAKESGPAARTGDLVQITKTRNRKRPPGAADQRRIQGRAPVVRRRADRQGPEWQSETVPIGRNDSNAPGGTSIAILFHKPLEPIKSSEMKKMLAPVLDFEKHQRDRDLLRNLPPETQKAIKEKRVTEGMNHEQVMLAMGRPQHKSRETKDGLEIEDWVYGIPPGKITFVTFTGDKVIKVKEEYAGLGTSVHDAPPVR